MNDNETFADIRKDAETKFRELVEAYIQRRSSFQTTMGAMQAFNNVFDRFEAAHKRELRESVTGSNQLREALVKARRFVDSSPLVYIMDNTGPIFRGELCAEIDAALAAPATAEKSSAVGDAEKLREALVYAEKVLDTAARNTRGETGMVVDSAYAEAARKCRAALAAPPRNCDRFASAEEAWDAYDEWADSYRAQGKTEPFNEVGWLLAPATETEGGNNANE